MDATGPGLIHDIAMARAVVTARGSVGEVQVVSEPWREAASIRSAGMALAMHDVRLRAPPESLMRWERAWVAQIDWR